jgi:mitogen-activated protein kinase 1/3
MHGHKQPSRFIPVSVHGKTQHEVFHVDEKYSDLKIIGSGSYGVVCAATDTSTNTKVAIKKITDALDDLVDAGRVLRELRLLRHIGGRENTLKIKDTYTYPPDTPDFDDVYIVTDLMETDMDRVLRSSQGLSSQHFGYFMYQLLRSVANMHRACVLHRDLKPSNLLVNANCDLVVCDFGLARGVSSTAKQPPNTARTGDRRSDIRSATTEDDDTNDYLTEYVVTRWYRPPEILAESPWYGAAADIWSVGCIFGEMLDKRRRPIFRGNNPQNQMQLIIAALGSPTEEELDFCTSTSSRGVIRRVCESVKSERCAPWNFEERFPGTDPKALDLLRKMLVFDPKKRITAEEALNHPFLQEVHAHWHKMEKIPKFDFSFEKVHHDCTRDRIIPKQHLQQLFLYEVNKYRSVLCRIPTPLHLRKNTPSRRDKKTSDAVQILQLSHRNKPSNQMVSDDNVSTLPMISNMDYASAKKQSNRANKVENRTSNVANSKKSAKLDRSAKLFRKVQPATVVPSNMIKKDKLSQSLKPMDNKDKMLSRTKKKSASSSALLRRNSSTKSSSSLIRRASKKIF